MVPFHSEKQSIFFALDTEIPGGRSEENGAKNWPPLNLRGKDIPGDAFGETHITVISSPW